MSGAIAERVEEGDFVGEIQALLRELADCQTIAEFSQQAAAVLMACRIAPVARHQLEWVVNEAKVLQNSHPELFLTRQRRSSFLLHLYQVGSLLTTSAQPDWQTRVQEHLSELEKF